jgi:hypothetical protein
VGIPFSINLSNVATFDMTDVPKVLAREEEEEEEEQQQQQQQQQSKKQ